jgi:hypothetical protein
VLAFYGSIPVEAYGLVAEDLYEPRGMQPVAPGERALLAVHDTPLRTLTAVGAPDAGALRSLLLELLEVPPDAHVGHTIHAWWLTEDLVRKLR